MEQNISFEGGGLKISEQVISKVITTIFPGQNYLDILVLIFVWFLVGLITLGIFFYFSKKRRMLKSMTLLQKGIFSIFLGFVSFMIVIITYLPFYFLGYDPLNFAQGIMLPFMILAGFLLYGCLAIASLRVKGRPFILETFKTLFDFFMVITVTLLAVSLTIKTKDWKLLLWFIVDGLYIANRIKQNKKVEPKKVNH